VAEDLELSEQQVANYKFDFIARLRTMVKKQELSAEVFPELADEEPA
jgi:RNA polymerase sigma-70 factor (ECF subfamily)